MRSILAFIVLAASLTAHPAVRVLMDRSGAVYYSDTAQVWRISPAGVKSLAVPNVHTHELWIDEQDNLFGEHLEYGGNAAAGEHWSHRVWKRSPEGQLSIVKGQRRGFLGAYLDFSFARDATGAMYWVREADGAEVMRRNSAGPAVKFGSLKSTGLGWMTVLPNGAVVLVDHGDIWELGRDGKVLRVIRALSDSKDQHALMGAWTDARGNLYVADYAGAAVKKIPPSGKVEVVLRCPSPWKPTGGLTASDGTIWSLEVNPSNVQRLTRISPDGQVKTF